MGQKPTAMDSSPSKRPRGRPRKDIIESPRSQIKKSPRSQIRKSPRSQTKPQSQSERLLSLRSRKNLFGTKIPQERKTMPRPSSDERMETRSDPGTRRYPSRTRGLTQSGEASLRQKEKVRPSKASDASPRTQFSVSLNSLRVRSPSNIAKNLLESYGSESSSPRKRGRPPNLNRSPTSASIESPIDENVSPRKRGRPYSPRTPSSTRSSPRNSSVIRNSNEKPKLFKERQNLLDFVSDKELSSGSFRGSLALAFGDSSACSRSSSRDSSRSSRRGGQYASSSDENLDRMISFIHDAESDDEENEEERLAAEMSNMSIKRTVSAKKVDYGRFNKFTSWKGIETSPGYDEFLRAVHDKIFHMEHVGKILNQSLQKVLNGDEGVLLTLYGKSGSGKRTVINQVFADKQKFNFVELNGRFAKLVEIKRDLTNVESLLKKDSPLVFVLYNFDSLRVTFANKVLYSLTNHLRKRPFFLLLVTEKENAVDALEKRIVSRVGQSSIKCMDRRLTVEDCWHMVHELVQCGIAACPDNTELTKIFKVPEKPPKNFENLCNRLPCYSELKLFVKQLADSVFDSMEQGRTKISIEDNCANLLRPTNDTSERLKCLTDRMYGLLIAAAIKTPHLTKWIPIPKIFQEYKRFLNTYDVKITALKITEEREFLDDLEYLVFQRFWIAKRQNQKPVAVCWLEDPLVLLDRKHRKHFNTVLNVWAEENLNDDKQLR